MWLGSVCLCGWNAVRAILIFGNYDTETPACTEKKEKHPSQNCHRKPADFTSFCKPVCSQWIINQHNPSQDVHFSLCILFLPLENMLIKLSCALPPGVSDAARCRFSLLNAHNFSFSLFILLSWSANGGNQIPNTHTHTHGLQPAAWNSVVMQYLRVCVSVCVCEISIKRVVQPDGEAGRQSKAAGSSAINRLYYW